MAELTYVRTPNIVAKLFRGHSELKISERIETLMFFYFSCLMSAGAILWTIVCLYNEKYLPAMISLAFILATALNFLSHNFWKDNKRGWAFQVLISIALPFVFQYALGGIVNSGVVMLWSVLALLGSMSFQTKKEITMWVGLFSLLCVQAFYVEATVFVKTSRNLPVLMAGMNFLLVSAIIFGLCHYFIQIQEKLQKTFFLKRNELKMTKEKIDRDQSNAKEFQDLLRSNAHVSKAFSNTLSFNLSKNQISGNFYWQGDFIQNHVVVFVENPHEGLRGNMEAMLLWNMIENSVSKAEVRSPHHLIEMIQRDFYSSYNVPQIRESMMEVKLTVICHDERKKEIQFASIGSTLLINEGDNVQVLCGFDRKKGETVVAPNGAQINIGRIRPAPSAKILFVNDALLEALDIKDDISLASMNNRLSPLFNEDFENAENELYEEFADSDMDKDLFLLGLQI